MWLIANFWVDPSFHLKVKEALTKRIAVKMLKDEFKPFSLSWVGFTSGAAWSYNISGELYGSGTTRDSVLATGTIDTLGSCYKPSTELALYVSIGSTDSLSTINDTLFLYFDGTLYGEGGYMTGKYNPSVGDSWEAWDTCLIGPLNTRFPIGDIDGDSIVDTAWVLHSTAQVTNATSSEFEVAFRPLRIKVWGSYLSSAYNVDSVDIYEYDRHIFYIGTGKYATHIDSATYIYYIAGTPLPQSYSDLYHKVMVLDISERPRLSGDAMIMENNTIKVTYSGNYVLRVYSASGRLLKAHRNNKPATYDLPYRKGVYFVVLRTDKGVLIKPLVR